MTSSCKGCRGRGRYPTWRLERRDTQRPSRRQHLHRDHASRQGEGRHRRHPALTRLRAARAFASLRQRRCSSSLRFGSSQVPTSCLWTGRNGSGQAVLSLVAQRRSASVGSRHARSRQLGGVSTRFRWDRFPLRDPAWITRRAGSALGAACLGRGPSRSSGCRRGRRPVRACSRGRLLRVGPTRRRSRSRRR